MYCDIHCILFKQSEWTVDQATQWLKENNYSSKDVDLKLNCYRFRQIKKQSGRTYKCISDNNVIYVMALSLHYDHLRSD
jgi:hypothetical protein